MCGRKDVWKEDLEPCGGAGHLVRKDVRKAGRAEGKMRGRYVRKEVEGGLYI